MIRLLPMSGQSKVINAIALNAQKKMQDPNESDPLIFGKAYHCWYNSRYLGEAIYEDNEDIGPSLVSMMVDNKGRLTHLVLGDSLGMPDKIKFV